VDVSGITVFAQVAVYPVVTVLLKNPRQNSEVVLVLPVIRQTDTFDVRNFFQSTVSAKFLRSLPENIWGFLLSTNIELLLKLIQGTSMLSDAASINASSTAAESDSYGAYIRNKPSPDAPKLVNTGTIEKFVSLWGIEELTHAGNKYLTPYLPLKRAAVTERRESIFKAPKLVFAKIARNCEAFLDPTGEYASVNTNCLYGVKEKVSLEFMAGYCNSKLFMFFYGQFFGALRMSGGYYQFQAPQLRVIPFKKPSEAIDSAVSDLVKRIAASKKRDPDAGTIAFEREIDRLVYKLYDLTSEEIAIIEESLVEKTTGQEVADDAALEQET